MGGRYYTGNNGLKSNLDTWLIVPSIGENTRCLLVIVRERSLGFRLRWRHVLRHCFSSTLHLTQQRASCPNDEYFVDLFKDSSNIIYFESLLRKSRRSQIIPIMQRRFYLRCHGNSQSQWLSTKTTLHIFFDSVFTVHPQIIQFPYFGTWFGQPALSRFDQNFKRNSFNHKSQETVTNLGDSSSLVDISVILVKLIHSYG